MSGSLCRPGQGSPVIDLTPSRAGWEHLGFAVHALRPGEAVELDGAGVESAVVTISGGGTAQAGGESFSLSREGVFEEMAGLLYLPPGSPARLVAAADSEWTFAVGSAPAEGHCPLRLFEPREAKAEIRGGGAALRQVNHVLAPPLPAERLIVFEVYVPAGAWAGWPAHCHDGRHGSPNLEETYYFRFDRPDGFGFHRNYVDDGSYDEVLTVRDGDCVAVPRGYHVTTAGPGCNMWILNFLAGEPVGEERARPPYFDPATTWITADWTGAAMTLPVAGPVGAAPGASQ